MAAVYPGQIKSFTTRTDFVDTILAAHMNEAQDEIAAIQTVLGTNPAAGAATVSARIASLEATVTDPNHTHPAGDITSGTLVVARGGTGAATHTVGNYLVGNGTSAITSKTPAQVLTDIGAAASGHTHTAAAVGASPVGHTHSQGELTGTVTVPDGGTGLTSLTAGSFLQGNGTGNVLLRTPAQVLSDIGAAASGHTHTPASIGAADSSHTHTPGEAGAAAAVHTHSAADVTSGTLSVARGGTGASALTSGNFLRGNGTGAVTTRTPAQVLTDIGAAAVSHAHSTADLTSGTLGVARGGLGLASVTAGNFLTGNGTGALNQRTPAQVLSDIGGAAASHTHTPAEAGAAAASHTHTPAEAGAAAASHTHSTTDITSGTLPVTRGGTGVTSFTSGSYVKGNGGSIVMRTPAQVLSDIGGAAASHTHQASEVSGIDATGEVFLLGGM